MIIQQCWSLVLIGIKSVSIYIIGSQLLAHVFFSGAMGESR